ncbi:MAG: iron-containing alcohol dehydrogenase [Mariprofundaceae bacterium]
MIGPFRFAAAPHIHFGAGMRARLVDLAQGFGRRALLVTGSGSLDETVAGAEILAALKDALDVRRVRVRGEPSPELVDGAVAQWRDFAPDVVIAIGGGSAMDAGKAIAGLLPSGASIMDHLEGVGRGRPYGGPSVPFIAAPTTAGTGGETSKNAVISRIGLDGFKKSFRHELLVARHVVLDPELTMDCPPEVSAACGMDALTQLIESYVSSGASPMTDALAWGALERAWRSLPRAVSNGRDLAARADMLYAASVSGLTLANAGLGSVHGLASPLGALFPIPHGDVCGTLLAAATAVNLAALRERAPDAAALAKYAAIGRMVSGQPDLVDAEACDALVEGLEALARRLSLPRLGAFGVGEADIPRIVAGSRGNSMRTNPVELTDDEIGAIVRVRL